MTQPALSSFSGFEGPEKKLEIDFKLKCADGSFSYVHYPLQPSNRTDGLRAISRERWSQLCSLVSCTILSQTSNDYCDSFVLSESSLFVYPQKFLMKTCGTTTLLACLNTIIEFAAECGLEVESAFYSRQRFLFPDKQKAPHTSFAAEVEYLNAIFPGGQGYCLGEQTGDHWYLYHVDRSVGKPVDQRQDRTLEIMMQDLDPAVMRLFHVDSFSTIESTKKVLQAVGSRAFDTREDFSDSPVDPCDGEESITAQQHADDWKIPSKLADLVQRGNKVEAARYAIRSWLAFGDIFQNITMDDHVFEPCGYSINGLLNGAYVTVHVTPELAHSFVSFETNSMDVDPQQLLTKVANTFRPGRVSLSVFADCLVEPNSGAWRRKAISVPGYRRRARTHYQMFSDDDQMPYDVLYTTLHRTK